MMTCLIPNLLFKTKVSKTLTGNMNTDCRFRNKLQRTRIRFLVLLMPKSTMVSIILKIMLKTLKEKMILRFLMVKI